MTTADNFSAPPTDPDDARQTVLLLGCGEVGRQLALQLPGDRFRCIGVRRRAMPHYDFIEYRRADICDPGALQAVLPPRVDVVIITATPSERSDSGYEQAYVGSVRSLLQCLDSASNGAGPRLVMFASSTSVYAQSAGEWVDELSATEPTGFSGRRMLEAEQLLLGSPWRGCCVRFSGIYGPGRQRLIKQVVDGEGSAAEPPQYGNRIHVEDCGGVLAHLLQLQTQQQREPEALYLASDSDPAPMHEVKQWIARELHLPPHHLRITAGGERGSKRCSNQRLLASGYRFRYPGYRDGYRTAIEAYVQAAGTHDDL
ncbi:NAD-dependent epimerase/dehydratase family protein [Pseudomaricurvus sp. HS19]|uniref:NAD-dependent epimerase/dehydratase family protein n=1 Tax=Pseudomaricurvus sp. HS19 TaxID=2692626 RepID=UPI00136E696F|nr:NAD-dependent epimerase/dehydratase family protein [Pseudomaricurvus sp. HS19]MYM63819.1 NAD-dependent epimerase/dehydratase family protein [Pseudomaricurvus sp. HS19]